MSVKETTEYVLTYIEHIVNYVAQFLAFIGKYISLYLLLGVAIAHVEQLISKKQSMLSVLISFLGASVVLYVLSPSLDHYLHGSKFYIPISFAIGYFINHIIRFVTNEKRINAWLLRIEKSSIEWLENKFKPKK